MPSDEYERWQNQMDEVTTKEIKICGDLAWAQTMYKNGDCDCDAEERRECTCGRTKEFKERAKAIREMVFPDAWKKDPLKMEMKRIVEERSKNDD